MKVLKTIFLVIIALSMAGLLVVIQVQNTLQNTVLSSKFFNEMYDRSDAEDILNEIVTESTKSLGENPENYITSKDIRENLDIGELEELIQGFSKGTFAYFMGAEDKLPEVELTIFKEFVLDIIVSKLKVYEEEITTVYNFIAENYSALDTSVTDNLDEDAINAIASQLGVEGSDAEMVKLVIEVSLNLDPNLSDDEKVEAITRELFLGAAKIEDVAEELDLDSFLNDYYGKDNPAEAIKDIIAIVKQSLFNTLLITLLLYILVVILTAFKPAQFFGWLAGIFMAGGLLGFTTGLIGMITPAFTRYMLSASPEILSGVEESILAVYQNISSGISVYFFIQGLIILLVGLLFLVLCIVLSKADRRNGTTEIKKNPPILALRIVLVIGLLIATIVINSSFAYNSAVKIEKATETLDKAATIMEEKDFAAALFDEINLPDLSKLK